MYRQPFELESDIPGDHHNVHRKDKYDGVTCLLHSYGIQLHLLLSIGDGSGAYYDGMVMSFALEQPFFYTLYINIIWGGDYLFFVNIASFFSFFILFFAII